jgi:acyl-CoA synthetase (AMP-forming)/AMP-acid ligase II
LREAVPARDDAGRNEVTVERATEFPVHARIEAQLTGPGAPFETRVGDVLGEHMEVFRERAPSLRALLEGSAGFGDREYIVQGDRRISFSDHLHTVASVASALRDRFGVRPGDRVAILAANCPEWIVTWWATVSLGAVAVGMNGWWTGDEILYALGDCEPKVVVGDAKRLARLRREHVHTEVVEIERDFSELWNYDRSASLPSEPIAEDDPACILYTSGTTGRPKGAVNTHRNIVALHRLYTFHGIRLLMIAAAKGPAPQAAQAPVANCTLMTTPLFHLSGLYTGAVTLLASGVKTVWTKGRFDPVQVMELIQRERITSWGPMGTMFHRVASHPDVTKYDLSSVRQVGSGGSPISGALQQRMRELFPNARSSLGLGYGLTEATGMVTLNFAEELERHPDSVGAALPTMQVEVRDADGKAVPDGMEGEIYLRGPLVMKEYWRNPRATRASILPGRWLRTGDWGRLDGGYLTINSRARDLILRGGENIYPAEIEQRLEAHPDVEEAAVLGVDHVELGQEVKAIVVPKPGRSLSPTELSRFVGETLAYFKVPSLWEIRQERLPRNATGKVLKGILVTGSESPFQEE